MSSPCLPRPTQPLQRRAPPPAPPGADAAGSAGPCLELVDASHAARAEVEAFIRSVYLAAYGARVRQMAPTLVALRDAQGRLLAAAGYRAAAAGALFLERYLPAPVEALLAGGANVPRAAIVEVGHLAARQAGEGRRLVLLLARHLSSQGFAWIVSTLTRELRQLVVRLGAAPLTLSAADPAALGSAAAEWGSYYEHQPVVAATRLPSTWPRAAADRGGA